MNVLFQYQVHHPYLLTNLLKILPPTKLAMVIMVGKSSDIFGIVRYISLD